MRLKDNYRLLFLCLFLGFAFLIEEEIYAQNSTAVNRALQSETARRQKLFSGSKKALVEGDQLYSAEEYASAAERYRFVLQNLPVTTNTVDLYEAAAEGLTLANVQLAEEALEARKFDTARGYIAEALTYSPEDKELQKLAKSIQKQAGEGTVIEPNTATTPEYVQAVEAVVRLLNLGEKQRETGQYLKAEENFKKALAIDPYNIAARDGLKRVSQLRLKYAKDAKANTRKQMLYEVTKAWSNPVNRNILKPREERSFSRASFSNIARLEEKLNNIIIDRINFDEASVEEAVTFLQAKAQELDPEGQGLNFVLKTTMATVSQPGEGQPGAGEQVSIETIDARRITLNLENLPLAAVLDLIAKQADLIYKVEEFAVVVAPASENIEALFTRTFQVPAGFIGTRIESQDSGTLDESVNIAREEVRTKLETYGVQFPPGSSANYLANGSLLVVRNTLDNLALIESVITSESQEVPQVQIETRFMEVNQTDLDELSFRWNVNRRGRNQSAPTDTPGLRTSAPSASTEILGLPVDLAVGGNAINANTFDALLAGAATAFAGPLGTAFQSAISLSKYKFELLVYALSQKTGADLLAVPKIVTKPSQAAEIRIARQFFYPDPQAIEPPQIDAASSRLPSGNTYRSVTPATPSTFKDEQIGVILSVNPQLYPDNQTIDLQLTPKVVDFEGFINYGSPINALDLGTARVLRVTDNVINTPVFNYREVQTRLSIEDGQTVLLGGLIREDLQKVDDKIPLLGDLPLLGRLFRSKIEQSIKKNLLIFVTCNLVRSDGELFNKRNFEDTQSFDNDVSFAEMQRWDSTVEPQELRVISDSQGGTK
jgi:general secretion pathway protein D